MNLYDGLPLYQLTLMGDNDRLECVSLVDKPAVESNFIAFNDVKKYIKFSTVEDKHMIMGVLMIPDMPMFRRDAQLGEYYVYFTKECIEKMVIKMLYQGTMNNLNIQHDSDKAITGLKATEIFIKDSSRGIIPLNFEDLPDGTAFATYKIYDDELWNSIKQGLVKGFSIEGLFSLVSNNSEDQDWLDVLDMLKKVKNC